MYKVYLISSGLEEKRYKIGYTRRDVKSRLKELKTGNSMNLEIESVFESKWGTKIEALLHRRYIHNKIEGEWFFLSDDDVKKFNLNCFEAHTNFEMLSNDNTWFRDIYSKQSGK